MKALILFTLIAGLAPLAPNSTGPAVPPTEGVVVTPIGSKKDQGGFKDVGGKSVGHRQKTSEMKFSFPASRVDTGSDDLGIFVQSTSREMSLGTQCWAVFPIPECYGSFHEFLEWQVVKKGDVRSTGTSFQEVDTIGAALRGQHVGCEIRMTGKSSFVPSGSPGYKDLKDRLEDSYEEANDYSDNRGGRITALPPPTANPEQGGCVVGSNNAGWVDQDDDGEEDAVQDTNPQEPTTAALLAATNPISEGSSRSVFIYWNDCFGFAMAASR